MFKFTSQRGAKTLFSYRIRIGNRRKFGCTCIWICKPARYDGLFLKFGDLHSDIFPG